jgi:polysaccharide biosynthesis protein PelC
MIHGELARNASARRPRVKGTVSGARINALIGSTRHAGPVILAVAILVGLTSCGSTGQRWTKPGAAAIIRLAVLPFDNQTPAPRAGGATADLIVAELIATGRVPVMDPGEVTEVLRRESLEPTDTSRLPSPLRLGRVLQVSHVLQGSVTEYRYKPGVSETPVAGLTARVIEVSTGEVVWTSSHARAGSTWFREDALAHVTQSIARDMAQHLAAVLGGPRAP